MAAGRGPSASTEEKPRPRAVPAVAAEASPAQHSIEPVLPMQEVLTLTRQQIPGSCPTDSVPAPWLVSLHCWGGFAWAGASQAGGRAGLQGSRVTCGKHPAVPSRDGCQDSGCADELVGPAQAVLDAIPAQPPGDAGAELVVHRAAAPPLPPARRAGGHWEGRKTGN